MYYILRILEALKTLVLYKGRFGRISLSASIKSPLKINGSKRIYIGKSNIEYKSWLAAMPLTGQIECKLIIEDGCQIGHFNHIYATGIIVIGKNVLTADHVYISDNLHGYEDIDVPILLQPVRQNGKVFIGECSWLGEHVCVIGASIGKHCVIGANSVVTHDIPDYCVAVGAPAYVIKRYNPKTQQWEKTDKKGNFLQQ